jgi:hypothetical protein
MHTVIEWVSGCCLRVGANKEATEPMVPLRLNSSHHCESLLSQPWLGWLLWNTCVTNDHGYVPLVVNTSPSWSLKNTLKTKDRAKRTPLRTEGERRSSGRVNNSCCTRRLRRVTLVTKPGNKSWNRIGRWSVYDKWNISYFPFICSNHSSSTCIWSACLSVDPIFQSLWFLSGFSR